MGGGKASLLQRRTQVIYLLILISSNAIAGFSDVDSAYQYEIKDEKPKVKKVVRRKKQRSNLSNLSKLLKDLEAQDAEIANILKNSEKRIIVKKSKAKLKALTRLEGILLNSALATNNSTVTLVIRLIENQYFSDSEIRCESTSFGKRVIGKCDLVVGENEYKVNAELWDMDGARGLIADKFYDGAEKEFLTSSFAAFFSAAADAAKDRILTPNGEQALTNSKNKALSGILGVSENIRDRIQRSADKNIQVSLVNSGKPVLIFFNEGVEL